MNDEYKFSESCERWFADIIGNIFNISSKLGYNSVLLVECMLGHELWRAMLLSDATYYTFGERYILSKIIKTTGLSKGPTFDPYVMWMYGYSIKWLLHKYPEDIDKIQQHFSVEYFNDHFGYYHTQGFNKIVEEAHALCNENN